MKKEHIQLDPTERQHLHQLVAQQTVEKRVYRRARALLKLDQGLPLAQTAKDLGITYPTISNWRNNYRHHGLACLQDQKRSGRPPLLTGLDKAKVTALATSQPPAGYAQWSVRLLADRLVELEFVPAISYNSVHQILKKTNGRSTSRNSGA